MKSVVLALFAIVLVGGTHPAAAQNKLAEAGVDVLGGMVISEDNEIKIGAAISTELRQRYGVAQDPSVHRYVTLVGRALAAESKRPGLPWTFIVLDTWGVNAFSAPGGYVHITKGALALIRSEAELAGVLAHEIVHVTEKHALAEMRRAAGTQIAAKQLSNDTLNQLASIGFNLVKNNLWGQPEEKESDRLGVELASNVGYAPTGLGGFLSQLAKRNTERTGTERNGLFSTHPDMEDRMKALGETITSRRLMSTSVLADRYTTNVPAATYQAVALTEVAARLSEGAKAATAKAPGPGATAAATVLQGGTQKFLPTVAAMTRQDAGVALARNVNVDADAPGGPISTRVEVTVTLQDLNEFRRQIEG